MATESQIDDIQPQADEGGPPVPPPPVIPPPPVPPPVSPPVPPPPGGEGDPHYVGFRGERYDFHGAPNRWFVILSDSTIQMTAKILAIPNDPIGTFHGQICLMVGTPQKHQRIVVTRTVDHNGLIATLDGIRITESGQKLINHLNYNSDVYLYNGAIFINTGFYLIKIHRTTYSDLYPHAEPYPFYTIPHLDFRIEKGPIWRDTRVHGVLGQTFNRNDVVRVSEDGAMQGEGVIDGTWTDYEVAGPWSAGFKFDCFWRTELSDVG